MNVEKRQIKASIFAGFTDILIGFIMFLTGWHQWYFDHFHFFGVLGIGMLAYGYWSIYFYNNEVGGRVWKEK
jgi:hypothetical protein